MRLVTRASAAAKGSTLRICEPMWTLTPAGSSHLDFAARAVDGAGGA